MEKTFYRIIGRKGRTTIPFTFRSDLGIKDNTKLKFEKEDDRIIITPVKECFPNDCDKINEISNQDAEEILEAFYGNALNVILSAVLKKIGLTSAGRLRTGMKS